jgi:hypothetical protein
MTTPRVTHLIVTLILFLLGGNSARVSAQDRQLPVELQAALLLKVVSYEKTLSTLVEEELVVGIIYQPDLSRSRDTRSVMTRALRSASAAASAGVTVRVVDIPLDGAGELPFDLRGRGVHVVYIAPLRAVRLSDVLAGIGTPGLLSFTGEDGQLRDGVAVGLSLSGDRAVVRIDLVSVRAVGAEFSSQLLKHAQIIRGL